MLRLVYQTFTRAIVALMMEVVSISETSVNLYQTAWFNIPEDSLLCFIFFREKNKRGKEGV
jgi:hypothetical protein